MEKLIQLLLLLINKAQFNSEAERDEALDQLRDLADGLLGAGTSLVPPKPGPTNAPPPEPEVEVPEPVAEAVPPDEQPPPPSSAEVGIAPEDNAFATSDEGAGGEA